MYVDSTSYMDSQHQTSLCSGRTTNLPTTNAEHILTDELARSSTFVHGYCSDAVVADLFVLHELQL